MLKRVVAACFVAAIFCCAAIEAQSLPPIEAFGSLPVASSPSLSPDGKYLALVQARNGRSVVTVWTLEPAGGAPTIIPYEKGFIVGARWVKDHRLLITINLNSGVWGHGVRAWDRGVVVDPDGQNPTALFNNIHDKYVLNGSTADVSDLGINDPENIYMPFWADNGLMNNPDVRNRMYSVNVITGRAILTVPGGSHTLSFYMDGMGKVIARKDRTENPLIDHILSYTDGNWREIATADATGNEGLPVSGVSADGKKLVLAANSAETGTGGFSLMSLADGKQSDLYFHPLYDVAGTIDEPWTGRVIGAAYTSHMTKSVYFDPKEQQIQDMLEAAFPGTEVSLRTWDRSQNKIVFGVRGPVSPTTFYIFNNQTKAITKLGRTYPRLESADLGQVQVYNYKARDGLEIPAYLTVPPGKTARNLPVVILPHGGPMARDNMSFDWESQFLANRGYAVLRPNFRGSAGYGRKFEQAGYGQWGLKMQDDITDGVKKLIADGIADPKRICIVGGSYGGYAALAGAAFTPDLYACAAAWAPVTDLQKFLDTRATDYGSDSWMISTWTLFIGDRMKNADKLKAASPAQNAAMIKVPVLLMHGEADATVRIDQSEAMDQALTKAKKKVKFVRIPTETHYMQAADTRIRWLTELEAFLKENIGN